MSWQQSLDLLEQTLADSTAMRTFLGAANATEAKAKIFQDALPPPAAEEYTRAEMEALRPYVVLSTEDAFAKYRKVRIATGCWTSSGSIWAMVTRNVPEGETPEQAQQSFRTSIGSIIDELIVLGEDGTGTHLHFREIESEGPWRVALDELEAKGDNDWCVLRFSWGPNQAQA